CANNYVDGLDSW
nr:immunoglobulin heavy chain junction region [Macaca mulatta]MOW98350.1 immunoglobulin heavy chain junction region [Macaca mulatta]MOW98403.1 immunoglobulin heavy chain junction region [Macaca mulatta]MOW98407.1 immunoglobulin heavy chain junction region [Macaca mulatta]MOW98895.1 immunoglobulin heavy chain junction region [Macaca mulatta]